MQARVFVRMYVRTYMYVMYNLIKSFTFLVESKFQEHNSISADQVKH